MSVGTKLVAVVVPLPGRPTLTPDEDISLRHLVHYLGRYDKYFIAPKGTRFARAGFELVTFSSRYFGSAQAHARLQLSTEFYRQFRSYKYILMYHLDALVLSDQLAWWCNSDLDYVGAPWLPCADSPWVHRARVGNSGFALMRVESFLNVLRSKRRTTDPEEYWRRFCAVTPRHRQWLNLHRKYAKRIPLFNNVKWETWRWPSRSDGTGNCDYFWSDEAVKYWPEFKIASVETGLRFAFEVAPRMCFVRNNRQLPFGCHAWPRYDRQFWEPYLLRDDDAVGSRRVQAAPAVV